MTGLPGGPESVVVDTGNAIIGGARLDGHRDDVEYRAVRAPVSGRGDGVMTILVMSLK